MPRAWHSIAISIWFLRLIQSGLLAVVDVHEMVSRTLMAIQAAR